MKRSLVISSLLLSAITAACAHQREGHQNPGAVDPGKGFETQERGVIREASFMVGDTKRELSFYTPSGVGESKLPIVIYLHGYGDNMRHILGKGRLRSASSIWMDVADREKFLMVYPLGLKGPGRRGKTGWNDCRVAAQGNPSGDDVQFVQQMIELMVTQHNGDRKRVYVTGMSNGGHMAMRIAMEIPEAVAAVAPIVALLPKASQCSPPSIPVPILMMHGTEDPLAPFGGGAMPKDRGEVYSARDTAALWVQWNQLQETQETTLHLPDRDPTDESTLIARVRESSPTGNAVVAYEMMGAGHTQPSREAKLGRLLRRIQGNQNRDVEMAELVWAFFAPRSR